MIDIPPLVSHRPVARVKDFGACFFTFPTGNSNQFITINLATVISVNWFMSPESETVLAYPALATVMTHDGVYYDVAGDNAIALWSCLVT